MKRCYFKNRSFEIATMIQLSKVILKSCVVGYFVAVAAICFKKWLFFGDYRGFVIGMVDILFNPFAEVSFSFSTFVVMLTCWKRKKCRLFGSEFSFFPKWVEASGDLVCWHHDSTSNVLISSKATHFIQQGILFFFGDSGIFWHNPGTQNYCLTSQANWICNLLLWWVTTAYYYNRHRYMIYKCTVYK